MAVIYALLQRSNLEAHAYRCADFPTLPLRMQLVRFACGKSDYMPHKWLLSR